MDRQSELNQILRSVESLQRSYVRFLNKSSRIVDACWLNYEGRLVLYKSLNPAEHFDINTFATHPWVFRACETRQLLVVKGRPIFYPPPADPEKPSRLIIEINLPVYPLKDICLHLISGSVKKEDIPSLHIPIQLKADLEKTYKN